MKNLNMRVIALFLTIIVFVQFTNFYYVQNEMSSWANELHTEHLELSERLDAHEEQLTISYGIIFDSSQKIEDIESVMEELNNMIYEIMDEYNKSNSKTNGSSSNKTDKNNNNNTLDDNIYDDWYDIYYGRLYVPNAGINVALYRGSKQSITDRVDSANIFTWSYSDGYTIADHNNQEFAKLFSVKIGERGRIELKNGNVINIKCVDVFNGHNTGTHIVDTSGVDAVDRNDYMMYTCIDNWKNVRICLWEITEYVRLL